MPDVRRDVFDALSQNRMAILSMQQVELSLEQIFLELTDSDESEQPAQTQPDAEPKKKKHRLFGRKRGDDK